MTTDTLTGKKSHKKLIIGLLIAAGVLGTGGYFGYQKFKPQPVMDAPQPMTEQAIVTDIENLYSTTGKVDSGSQISMNSKATGTQANTGYIVDTVYVNVGTEVKKGDLLFTVDTTDLENQIDLDEQKLALQQEANAIASAAASRKLAEAQETSAQQYDDATRKLQDAADDTNQGLTDQIEAQQNVAKYTQEVATYQAAYDAAKAERDKLKTEKDNITIAMAGSTEADSEELQYQARVNADLANAETNLSEIKSYLDKATSNLEAAEKTLKSNASATEKDVRALESEGSSTLTNNRTTKEAEATAADGVATQRVENQSKLLEMQQSLEKNKQKLEGSSVLADMDGIVTAVNVMNGQLYTGTNAIVINNLESMKVTSDIDEAHIADIFVGQEVHITTESTGENVLNGKVTYCSPTPVVTDTSSTDKATNQNANTSTSKKRAAYRVEVMLDEPNERLRIGMTAKMDFVIQSAKNVVAVPSAAIHSDGVNSFIQLIPAGSDTSDTTLAVETMVSTGVANDYYTEITSGNVKEGDSVVEESQGADTDLLSGIYE